MGLLLIIGLALAPPAGNASNSNDHAGNSREPIHARTCEGAIAKFKPGEPAKLNKLNRLPPAETYAAVYYTDGCPRRLIEAQGKRRR